MEYNSPAIRLCSERSALWIGAVGVPSLHLKEIDKIFVSDCQILLGFGKLGDVGFVKKN